MSDLLTAAELAVDRERFVRDNAATLLAERDEKIARQAEVITKLHQAVNCLRAERDRLKAAHRTQEEASDYCYVCGCHPGDGDGHAADCLMR